MIEMNNSSPTTLYIIGNGFDLHHKLNTSYRSFGLFLRENQPELYEYLLKYLGFPNLDEKDEDGIWANFEVSLANLEFEAIIDEHLEYAADIGSGDFSDGDWNTIAIYMKQIRNNLTDNLFGSFKEFILNVDYPKIGNDTLIKIEENSIFLTFNYTKSLELYYGISQEQILHIHNKAESEDTLILGHGIDPETFEQEEVKPPEGLSEDELSQWEERQNDNYNFSIELEKSELMQYFKNSFKPTHEIIEHYENFFMQLKSISKVYVLGHSISDIDFPYLEKIVSAIGSDKTEWFVSYYKPEEAEDRWQKLLDLNLGKDQIKLIKMAELIKG